MEKHRSMSPKDRTAQMPELLDQQGTAQDTEYGRAIFIALQRKSSVYQGSVPWPVVQRRRAASRRARASRRGSRQ